MSTLYHTSSSPHIRAGRQTSDIMRDVLLALLPACGVGIWVFGVRALWILLVSVAACVLSELLFEWGTGRPITVADGSAAVTGVLLALNLPATVPLWLPALGGVFAVVLVKQLFGGIGKNFMNPALAARCFLLLSFGALMGSYPAVDGVSSATPLAALKAGESEDWVLLLIGRHSGCIGETSAAALLLGGVYLVVRRVISPQIPLIYIGSMLGFAVLFRLLGGSGMPDAEYLLGQLLGGGLMIGAVFMATDYVTCPITPWGRVLYALLLGLLTALFRVVGKTPEGVSYAIILGNIAAPLLERLTLPKPFGSQEAIR